MNSTIPAYVDESGKIFNSAQGISRELASIVNLDEILLGESNEAQGEVNFLNILLLRVFLHTILNLFIQLFMLLVQIYSDYLLRSLSTLDWWGISLQKYWLYFRKN